MKHKIELLDYDTGMGYEFDEYVSEEHLKLLNSFVKEIKKDLIPKLNVFKDFKVYPIILMDEFLGIYCFGTSEKPIIGVDIGNILVACEKYPEVSFGVALFTTIIHELGHAIQQYKGKKLDEDEAEDFAQDYQMFGIINKI